MYINFIHAYITVYTAVQVGLAQSGYTVGEADGTISVCVVFVGDSGIDVSGLTVDIMVTTTDVTATGN